jgi:hypothetical protein
LGFDSHERTPGLDARACGGDDRAPGRDLRDRVPFHGSARGRGPGRAPGRGRGRRSASCPSSSPSPAVVPSCGLAAPRPHRAGPLPSCCSATSTPSGRWGRWRRGRCASKTAASTVPAATT